MMLADNARRSAGVAALDAAAMAARGALEAALVGLYALYDSEAAREFNGEAAHNIQSLLGGQVAGVLGQDVIGLLTQEIGSGQVPRSMQKITNRAIAGGGGEGLVNLVRSLYQPISTLSVHTSALSLLRHVNLHSLAVRSRPFGSPSRRSLIDMAEGSVGLLAAELAGREHSNYTTFVTYSLYHFGRPVPLWTRFMTRAALAQVDPKGAVDAFKASRLLRTKARAGAAITDRNLHAVADTVLAALKHGHAMNSDLLRQAITNGWKRANADERPPGDISNT